MPNTRLITPLSPPEKLISNLAAFRQLPIIPGTQEVVLASLRRPNANAQSVATACQRDPILQFQLWLTINETLQQSGNELHHLAHGISLLGLPKVEQLVRNATQMITPNSGYLECIMQSEISQRLALELSTTEASDIERWSMATLFARSHEWALWHHFPSHMSQRQGLLINPNNGKSAEEIETLLLGQSLQEISAELSDELPLPQPLKTAWTLNWDYLSEGAQACLDNDIQNWIQHNPAAEVVFFSHASRLWLINMLAYEAALNTKSDTYDSVLHVLARQSMRNEDQIMSLCHQAMVLSSTPLSDWPHPASRLLQHWQAAEFMEPLAIQEKTASSNARRATQTAVSNEGHTQSEGITFGELAQVNENGDVAEIPLSAIEPPQKVSLDKTPSPREPMPEFLELPTQTTKSSGETLAPQDNPKSPQYREPTPEAPPPTSFRNNTLLDEHLKRLLERGDQFSNLNQLLLFTLDTLAEGVGLERLVIMIIHDKRALRSHYSRGLDKKDPLRELNIPLDDVTQRGIVGQLFKQPAALNITSANIALVQSRSPSELSPHLTENSTALMSLFHDSSPIGIVYAASNHFEAKQFQQLKRVCNAASKAISAFAKQKYKNANTTKRPSSKAAQ